MKLEITGEDLFAQGADALIVSIDGAVPPSEPIDRVLGNVGRQLVRRFAAQDVLDQIESQLDLPLALGRAQSIPCEGLPFSWLLLVSTLHHTGAQDESEKRALVSRAFSAALECASRVGAHRTNDGAAGRLAAQRARSFQRDALGPGRARDARRGDGVLPR